MGKQARRRNQYTPIVERRWFLRHAVREAMDMARAQQVAA